MTDRKTRLADGEDLEVANPEDFEVQRDGDGEIIPVKQRVPGTDLAIEVRPLPPGAFAEHLDVLEMQDEDSEAQAAVIREYVAAPEPLANADADYVENELKGGWLSGILQAIRNSAGYEVFRAVREDQTREMAAMMEHMGDGQMTDLVTEFADSELADGA